MHEHLLVAHLTLILKRKQLVEQNGRKNCPELYCVLKNSTFRGSGKEGIPAELSTTSYYTAQDKPGVLHSRDGFPPGDWVVLASSILWSSRAFESFTSRYVGKKTRKVERWVEKRRVCACEILLGRFCG